MQAEKIKKKKYYIKNIIQCVLYIKYVLLYRNANLSNLSVFQKNLKLHFLVNKI